MLRAPHHQDVRRGGPNLQIRFLANCARGEVERKLQAARIQEGTGYVLGACQAAIEMSAYTPQANRRGVDNRLPSTG
jgi:hypothetical protein